MLASSAVLGLVVGFAARQTLANGIAGILLAITQPIRIGDLVTFEDETGEVEDMRLTYTYIRLDDGRRLIVPNERLAQSSVENHTVVDPRVQVEVSVWLPPDADLDRALELIADEEESIDAAVAEVDKEGVRLSATTWADTAARARRAAAADLRRPLAASAPRARSILGRDRLTLAPAPMTSSPATVRGGAGAAAPAASPARPRRDRDRRPRSPCSRWPATCSRSRPPPPT